MECVRQMGFDAGENFTEPLEGVLRGMEEKKSTADLTVVTYLLDIRIYVGSKQWRTDRSGYSLLDRAVEIGNTEILEPFIACGKISSGTRRVACQKTGNRSRTCSRT